MARRRRKKGDLSGKGSVTRPKFRTEFKRISRFREYSTRVALPDGVVLRGAQASTRGIGPIVTSIIYVQFSE